MKQAQPRVKICGMKSHAEIETAASFGADAVGIITEVPVKTRRKVDLQTAAALISKVPLFVKSVMVIMPENAEHATEMIEFAQPDVIQLHSYLNTREIEKIRDNTDVQIIKTFQIPVKIAGPVDQATDKIVEKINSFTQNCLIDGVLLDSHSSAGSGGTGRVHRWDISQKIVQKSEVPVILAGGLDPSNISEAVRCVAPYGVDTASGIETNGEKDREKIELFIRGARCIE
ncbi:Phosphoribosylanthranilate isomerase [Methanosalsum zhilinae DSM 4017]|uniref:N-(5'-phosphoribosyl)anthranilate isomerase n=1 Tax=Methanosalsum zhilinae (strain DSM 4017 / NBRC 107636 / OCM 62 / WeN5) TaxID=679901 RepID=F7XN98_METZD|nr:phosphoribosylanthranilate isomerase [Methanosalsum zhilinae]AEH60056.1 Phosphoribosylanthranilate isomerase [Methanosalsum zhilinae DSM 4017]